MFQLTSLLALSDVVSIFFSSIIVLTPNGSFWTVPQLLSVSNHQPHEMYNINNVFTVELFFMVTTGLNILVIKVHKLQNVFRTFSICKQAQTSWTLSSSSYSATLQSFIVFVVDGPCNIYMSPNMFSRHCLLIVSDLSVEETKLRCYKMCIIL